MEPARSFTPRIVRPAGSTAAGRSGATPSSQIPPPFWGRFGRALVLVGVASAVHLWLPHSSALRRGSTAATATPTVSRQSKPEAVDVVTEFVPVGTSGAVPPAVLEPNLIPRTAPTLQARRAEPGGPMPRFSPGRQVAADGEPRGGSGPATPTPIEAAPLEPLRPTFIALNAPPRADLPAHEKRSPARPARDAALSRDADQQQLVRRLLDQYVTAFERLDADAAKAVWPTVDGKALRRAFEQLQAQHLTFQSCGITIDGSDANARCQGEATYRPRVGSRLLRIAPREWTFNLAKADDGWRIVDARVR